MRKSLMRGALNLAPSVVILAGIGVGAALGLSWFRLAWENDFLFGLLVLAVLLPWSRLPLLVLGKMESEFALTTFPDFARNERERTAQAQILQTRLEHLRDS